MNFKGYSEERRGRWFSTQIIMNHWSDIKECELYMINEQDKYFIRVRDEKQIQALNCLFALGLEDEKIDWLKYHSGFQYFDNVDEFIAYEKEMLENL